MLRQWSAILLLALASLGFLEAGAEEPVVVAIDQEPLHRLAFYSKDVRVFDTRIPSGETTLYHRHDKDSVYVLISGTEHLVGEQLGKAPKRVTASPGDVFFGEHSKSLFTHRFSNFGTEEHHVLDIELVSNSASPNTPAIGLPEGHRVLVENPRVRVSRFVIEPAGSFQDDLGSPSAVLVSLGQGHLALGNNADLTKEHDTNPGWFFAFVDSGMRTVSNLGESRLEVIYVEIK